MKTHEELNAHKEEVEIVSRKLCELTEEELEQVVGSGNHVSQSDVLHKYMTRLWQNTDSHNNVTHGIELIIDGHKHEAYRIL